MSSENNVCLKVQVQPKAREQKIQKTGEKEYTVRVLSPPSEGKANKEVIAVLASYFHIPPSRVKILKGKKSRQKIVVLEVGV
ncbi:MAG: YggU family protein [Candidatus Aminicenantes bacterium]|nr:MAG: YggU family protein [Candidatus Aminicenantes bacterium]